MANTKDLQVLVNTDRKLVIKFTEFCDGTTATNTQIVVDISDSSYNHSDGSSMTGVAVERVWADSTPAGFVAEINWDADSDLLIASTGEASGNMKFFQDYTLGDWGGLDIQNNTNNFLLTATGTNPTGDIRIQASGMSDLDTYFFIIEMRKLF